MIEIRDLLSGVGDKQALLEFLQRYMTDKRTRRFEEVLTFRTRHITLALEDLYQERNANAVIRTADCFGIQDGPIIENFHQYKISSGISKGAEKWVNIHLYDRPGKNTETCIDQLKKKGYRIIATSPHRNDTLVYDYDIRIKSAFFLGGEKEGLSEAVMNAADGFVKLPMYGFTESFNISVAAALLLENLTGRLRQSDIPWSLSDEEKLDLRLDWTIKTIASAKNLIEKFRDSNQK
ncbi:MAG: RNA methyltransferase [Cyclobacteriaceae bacterium]|nr:RNA methyltransferase [Cyclobacteriaceae bacterium]